MLPIKRLNNLSHLKSFSNVNTIAKRFRSYYHVIVIGGGAGGISVASKFQHILKKNELAIIEPSNVCII